jgi:tight adherence protein B
MIDMNVLRAAAAGGVGLGLVAVGTLAASPDSLPRRLFDRYTAKLDTYIRLLPGSPSARTIAFGQIVAIVAIVAAAIFVEIPYWWAFLALAVFGPIGQLHSKKAKRMQQLELQVDGFLLAYANGLKAVPNPAAALLAVVGVLQDPMRYEVDRALREMRVGATLDQALQAMSARLRNRVLDNGLLAVHIGTQVGGDLPGILSTTAATLREMQRLDGVVKTKTAEGKSQLWVLAAFPFGLLFMFGKMSPGYFDPLRSSVVGYIVSGIAITFWVAAIAVARKILAVDI